VQVPPQAPAFSEFRNLVICDEWAWDACSIGLRTAKADQLIVPIREIGFVPHPFRAPRRPPPSQRAGARHRDRAGPRSASGRIRRTADYEEPADFLSSCRSARKTPACTCWGSIISDFGFFDTRQLASWPTPSLARTKGNWLGALDQDQFFAPPLHVEEECRVHELQDGSIEHRVGAFLYLGPQIARCLGEAERNGRLRS
jgi:hypothetical protein